MSVPESAQRTRGTASQPYASRGHREPCSLIGRLHGGPIFLSWASLGRVRPGLHTVCEYRASRSSGGGR
eukprot:292077-Rhodomonas_salina.2